MDAVSMLLQRYGIADPVKTDTVGQFQNADLQALFNQLTGQGGISELGAMQIGAQIEELDIADLQKHIAETDKADLAWVYNRLLEGSYNHLRAYMRQIQRLGGGYVPQYISQQAFDAILNADTHK